MRFAHPVLQERERVAEQAREARVRLSEGSPTVALHRFMTERLRLIDTDLDAVELGRPPRRRRHLAGHRHLAGRRRSRAPPAGPSTSPRAPSRPYDAATMDFAEGTRLVRVVPDVPVGMPAAPSPRPPVSVLRDDRAAAPSRHDD